MVTAVLTGIVNYKDLNIAAPIALAADYINLAWLKPLIKIGAIAGLSTVSLVLLMSQSRIFFSMSNDGLLPRFFGKVSKKHHTPINAIYVTELCATLIAGFVPIKVLGELVSLAALLSFSVVCASVLILRKKNPTAHRPFRTPWVPFVPIMGLIICGLQMFSLPFDTWVRLLVWMAIGLLVYFTYGIKHSKIN